MSVLPPIEEEFVSAGQVRVEMRLIAILGEESELAAQAAECANDQGRFWDYHDVLFANQEGKNRGAFLSENLKRFAEALALDGTTFDSCLDSGKYASSVRDDTAAAGQMGVNSTPTILVNGKEVTSTLDDVRAAIQEELASGS